MQRIALPSATKAPTSRISRNSRVPVSARPCGVRAAAVGIEKEDYIDTVPDSLLRAGIDDQNSMKGKFERVRWIRPSWAPSTIRCRSLSFCLPLSAVFRCLPLSSAVFRCLPLSSAVFRCLPLSSAVVNTRVLHRTSTGLRRLGRIVTLSHWLFGLSFLVLRLSARPRTRFALPSARLTARRFTRMPGRASLAVVASHAC
jgi:hypothetical protein